MGNVVSVLDIVLVVDEECVVLMVEFEMVIDFICIVEI